MELHCDLKPPPRGPKFDFWTPSNAKPERILCLSEKVWAHHVHWTGKNNQPCTLKLGLDGQVTTHCAYHKAQMPVRWRGYLHVFRYDFQKQEFLCLPEAAGDEVFKIVELQTSLRGLTLEVFRLRGKMNAELIVRHMSQYGRKEPSIEEIDPGPYLDTLFRKRKPIEQPVTTE